MAQCCLCGDIPLAKKETKISIGFKLFLIGCDLVVTIAILFGAWLMDKILLAPLLIVAFRVLRVKIEQTHEVLHCATISTCMLVSTAICLFGLYLSLPIKLSLISNIIVGAICAIVTWQLQGIKEKPFSTDTCTREELVARCIELRFSKENTDLAIKFFIDKTKQSEIADELCIEEKSVQMRKRRLKQKLNNNVRVL